MNLFAGMRQAIDAANAEIRQRRIVDNAEADALLRLRAKRANDILDATKEVVDAARALVAGGSCPGLDDFRRLEHALADLDAAGAQDLKP